MKKLLSIISSFSLVSSSAILTAQVVACEGKYSNEIYNIIAYDAAHYFGMPLYSYDSFVKGENGTPVDKGIEGCAIDNSDSNTCSINPEILSSEHSFKFETWIQVLIKYFEEASTWFEGILAENDYAWKVIVLKDFQLIQETEKNLNYEMEIELLDILLDEIVTTDFQLNIAKLAVLKRNIKLVEVYQKLYLNRKSPYYGQANKADTITKVSDMIKWVNEGIFMPLFKFVYLEETTSRGPTQTKIRFDKRLIEYIDTGRHGAETLKTRYYEITKNEWNEFLKTIADENSSLYDKLEYYSIYYNLRETLDLYAYDPDVLTAIREEIGGE